MSKFCKTPTSSSRRYLVPVHYPKKEIIKKKQKNEKSLMLVQIGPQNRSINLQSRVHIACVHRCASRFEHGTVVDSSRTSQLATDL